MSLQEVKDSAPDLKVFAEMQFIVDIDGVPTLLGKCMGMGHSGITMINNWKVISSRSFTTRSWYDRK